MEYLKEVCKSHFLRYFSIYGLREEGVFMVLTKCEVYSRVVGYIRPVEQWNDAKQAEFNDRKTFDESTEDMYCDETCATCDCSCK